MKLILSVASLLFGFICPVFSQNITGSGTSGFLTKFSGTSVVTSSLINDNGTNVGIGTTTPAYKLDVNGTANFSSDILVKGINIGSGTGTGSNNYTNSVFGTNAGSNITNASGNTFMGYRSAVSNTTGSNNTFNGLWTGFENTTGSFNSYFGENSGRNITTGSNNTLIGANITTLGANTSNNIVIADGSGNRRINVDNNGWTGVGVASPTANLEVAGGWNNGLRVGITSNRANCSTQLANSLAVIGADNMATTVNGAVAWDYYNNGTSPSWSGALLEHIGTAVTGTQYGAPAANQGQLVFQNVSNAIIGTNGANLFISPGGTNKMSTAFLTDGSVGIGTTKTTGYSLAVNGPAIFTKAVVKLYANWPDYVFAPVYKLPTLPEVEAYINKHQHLADIPSSADIEKDGIDLGDNQAKLLKKVEELTLYMIDLNKKMEALSKENSDLKAKFNNLKP